MKHLLSMNGFNSYCQSSARVFGAHKIASEKNSTYRKLAKIFQAVGIGLGSGIPGSQEKVTWALGPSIYIQVLKPELF